ncbi:Heavy metal tolerance protein [Lachnellula suecica]|uniref:Heavy metal tolerance protein n=1 Tax=Lachnellula suecica TaxID=602035 RepID=A0A8T9C8F0_9HELO|nr:Heavy metal tolerance protein [Lachnellula suecica]
MANITLDTDRHQSPSFYIPSFGLPILHLRLGNHCLHPSNQVPSNSGFGRSSRCGSCFDSRCYWKLCTGTPSSYAAANGLANRQTVTVLVDGLTTSNWVAGEDRVVYLIASAIVFGIQVLALTDTKFPVWYPYYGTWFVGSASEITLLALSNVVHSPESAFDYIEIIIRVLRICIFILLPAVYFGLRNDKKKYDNSDAERQSLLRKKLAPEPSSSEDSTTTPANTNGNGYGSTDQTAEDSDSSDDPSEDSYIKKERKAKNMIQKRLKQDGNWFTYAKGFTVFFPYVWPAHNRTLQIRAAFVVVCLLSTNALNALIPYQMGVMIDTLTKYAQGDHEQTVWMSIGVYALLLFLIRGGAIHWIQQWLWIPVEQYSYDALCTASHAHIMTLSSDFHDSKTSSDLINAINGGKNVAELLDTICFQVVPMFIDLGIAVAYLWAIFGPYMGLIIALTAISYFYITTKLVSQRAQIRRDYITLMRKEWTVGYSSLEGWSTASLFNNIPHEQHRYSSAVKDHLKHKMGYDMSSLTINLAQALIVSVGLFGALALCGFQVISNRVTVGKLAMLLAYWGQLSGPLFFFSNMFRSISYCLMDAERLLELFQTKPTINDSPNAKPMKLSQGLVKFDRVSFAYDKRKPTLSDVTFIVPPGKSVALVGETGGGKSTILKLIGRFYDVNAGGISIDGQDIRDVTISSLREKIGVVPQDPTLFDDSIMNNVRYSRLSATDEEVYEACRAAAIHDKILTFPDGYRSMVGPNGVKLSGGEKQRVAIARAILKRPELILLDEATSAVDTGTEELIQQGFNTLCKGRTTFIVAHRLSTIMKADHILVVMDGKIVEQGSHHDLIRSRGKYHDLWSKQVFVKPESERSRSRSPDKRKTDIVNDLSPAHHKAELSKAMETMETTGDSRSSGQDANKENDGKKSSSDHKREGSKLKPNAPEFVPLQLKSKVSDSIAKSVTKEAAKLQKKLEKEERKAASLSKKAGKKMIRFQSDGRSLQSLGGRSLMAIDTRTGDESTSAGVGPLTEAEGSGNSKPKFKRARFSRRNMTKSEPPNRIQSSQDGAQDSDMTAVSSGEGQPLLPNSGMQRRRVSAPSDPPASQETRTRPRRTRHWRLKHRAADNAASGSASAATTSGEASTSDERPTAPVTTPAEGVPRVSGGITFAPGS